MKLLAIKPLFLDLFSGQHIIFFLIIGLLILFFIFKAGQWRGEAKKNRKD